MVYKDQPVSLIVAWIYAFTITAILEHADPQPWPWLWLAAMTVTLATRWWSAHAYAGRAPGGRTDRLWERRFFAGAVVTGACWGTLAWYSYPIAEPSLKGAVVLLIGGVIAATSRTIACQLAAFCAYAAASGLPLTMWLFAENSPTALLLGGFALCFMLMMMGVGRSFRNTVARSFWLRFENEDLAARLQRDMAAREAAETALRASEERLRFAQYALDHAQDLVAIIDREGNLLHASDALCRHTGRSAEELYATKAWAGIFALDAERFASHWDQVKQRGALTFETEVLGRDGERKPIEVNASYVEFNGREAAGMIGRDLAPRRAAEQEKLRLMQQLQETQKLESLGVLAGGVAHDFNNLLTAILGNATLARESLAHPADVADMLGQIERAADQAAGLCRQMLAYAGKGQLLMQPLDLSAMVMDTVSLVEMTIGRRARLELRLAAGLPAVRGDSSQLRQILINLVHNGAEAITGRDGRIVVSTERRRIDGRLLATAQVRSEVAEGEGVALIVSDNGAGMDRETQERIFEPFFTTKFTGRGLGLAAVLGIVRAHGALLDVQSESGRGTTFTLVLPAVAAEPIEPAAAAPAAPAGGRRKGRVLVVDDERSIRDVARQVLQRMGLTVDVAADGDAALALCSDEPRRYDLMLIDITMPGQDGIATLRELRRRGTEGPAVLMSGFSEQQIRERAEADGIADFLQKPFDYAALWAKVEAVLDRRN